MAAVGRTDEMIRDYLLFRGFTSTLKAFDTDLKNEREKGFRADRVLDQLHGYINTYDIVGLKDYWAFLDTRIFSRLEHVYTSSIKKLEVSLFKYYVVNAVQNGKLDKVNEFYEKLAPDLQHQAEWKDWFVLPFVKNPEESSQFAVHFSRQWQDTFLLSLHNFLSVITHAMHLPIEGKCTKHIFEFIRATDAVPALLAFEEDRKRMVKLQQENERYKQQISVMMESGGVNSNFSFEPDPPTPTQDHPTVGNMDLMDDFFHISQDTVIEERTDSPVKTSQIRSFIKNIGLPSSPVLGKKAPPTTTTVSNVPPAKTVAASGRKVSTSAEPATVVAKSKGKETKQDTTIPKLKKRPVSGPTNSSSTSSTQVDQKGKKVTGEEARMKTESANVSNPGQIVTKPKSGIPVLRSASVQEPIQHAGENKAAESTSGTKRETAPPVEVPDGKSTFLLLSQEEYAEHRSSITHCRFSPQGGQVVATSDVDGVVKVWALQPSPVTMATIMSKSMLISLDWLAKSDRLLLLGNKAGSVRLFDVKEKKTLREVQMDASYPRIVSLSCSPAGATFACSASAKLPPSGVEGAVSPRPGHLGLYDVKTMKMHTKLTIGVDTASVNCTAYSNNGQLLVTGASDGYIRIYDGSQQECVHSWAAHTGDVYTVVFSPDLSSVYSMGADGKFIEWNLKKNGSKKAELNTHQGACGPFVLTAPGGYRQIQTPKGRLFAFDSQAKHVLTCATNGGLIYKLEGDLLKSSLLLPGHKSPITTVDWSLTGDTSMCLTGSMDGALRVSTLLPQ